MKRTVSLLFLSLAVVLGLSMSASAQIVEMNDAANVSVNGGSIDGYLTGPYAGTVNGGPTQNFVCDDFTLTTTTPWYATVGSSNPLTGTVRFTSSTLMPGATKQQEYNAITYLAMQILTHPSATVADENYNAAIWDITSNGKFYDSSAAVLTDVGLAIAADNQYNGDLTVYTPTNYKGVNYLLTDQEYLTTPEPLSMALMGTFLTLAGLGLGRKKLFA
jgi:hypothetical protein